MIQIKRWLGAIWFKNVFSRLDSAFACYLNWIWSWSRVAGKGFLFEIFKSDIGHILFLRILYHIPYHGPKKDIISYHISRPKKGYRIYILYPFQFENEPNMAWIGIKHRKVVISMFILEICNCLQMPVQCSVCVQCSVLSKRELPTTSVNKNYIVQKKKNAAKFKFVLKKGYRIG
jgi:hypothetical protein